MGLAVGSGVGFSVGLTVGNAVGFLLGLGVGFEAGNTYYWFACDFRLRHIFDTCITLMGTDALLLNS